MDATKEIIPNARPISKYINYLACPHCKSSLAQEKAFIVCSGCARKFETRDNFPILLPLDLFKSGEWQNWKILDSKYQSFYKSWTKENHIALRPVYDAFYDWCGVKQSRNVSILDVGGGNGTGRVMYWGHPENIDYFDVDPQVNFLHPFHVELYPRVSEVDFPYIIGVGEYLPLKSNNFDICVNTASIDHYQNPSAVFHEIYRCLKPGAKLFIMITKEGKPDLSFTQRVARYYRNHGLSGIVKRISEKLQSVPIMASQDAHAIHFHSLQDVTKLLHMFKVTRAKESELGSQIYIECVKIV